MDCKNVHSHAHDLIDGRCTLAESQEVSSHLHGCAACTEYVNSLQLLKKSLGEFPVPGKRAEQWDAIELSILKEIGKVNTVKQFSTPKYRHPLAAAAVLLLTVVSLYFIVQNYVSQQHQFNVSPFPAIVNVQGKMTKNGQAYEVSGKKSTVIAGEEIVTASGSKVIIKSDSGSTLTIGQNSKIAVTHYSKKNQTYLLERGAVDVEVSKRTSGQLFLVKTPNAVCEVVGTKFSVDVKTTDKGLQTILKVVEGCVKLKAHDGDSVFVNYGTEQSITNGVFDYSNVGNQVHREQDSRIESCSSAVINTTEKPTPVKNGGKDISVSSSSAPESIRDDMAQSKLRDATLLFESGKSVEALAVLDTLSASGSLAQDLQYDVFMKKARILKMLKKFNDACEMYSKIADGNFRNEQKGNAVYQAAVVKATELRDIDGAIEGYRRYIHEFKDGLMIPEAYYSLGDLYHSRKQFAEEAKLYKEFIEKFSDIAGIERAIYTLAQLYSTEMGDCARSVGLFTHLGDKYPDGYYTEDALFWKASCLQSEGRAVQAIDAYKKYIEKYPQGRWAAEARERSAGSESVGRNQ